MPQHLLSEKILHLLSMIYKEDINEKMMERNKFNFSNKLPGQTYKLMVDVERLLESKVDMNVEKNLLYKNVKEGGKISGN